MQNTQELHIHILKIKTTETFRWEGKISGQCIHIGINLKEFLREKGNALILLQVYLGSWFQKDNNPSSRSEMAESNRCAQRCEWQKKQEAGNSTPILIRSTK